MKTPRLFSLRARSRRALTATIQPAVLALLISHAYAGNTWDGGGGDNNWGTGANWSPDGSPAPGSGNDLFFAGGTRLTPFNNYTAFDDWRNIFFNVGAGAFNITGNAIDLFGKIENLSATAQTFGLTSIAMNSATNNEFNPVNGDLTITSTDVFTNGNQLKVFGNNGFTLTFGAGTIIKQAGSLSINQNSNVVFNSVHTYTGDTFINAGKLRFNAGGGVATSVIRLGDTTGAANAALDLTVATGGQTLGGTVVSRAGSSGVRTIDSQNTSGMNTLSAGLFLDATLTLKQAGGGTLTIAGGTVDIKGQAFTVDAAGTVSATGIVGSSFGAGGSLVKQGSGTLLLSNAANNYTGTNTATLNANGTQIAAGTLGISADGSLGLAPSGAYNNLQFTGTATLQNTVGNISLNANRNVSVASAATATFDNNGNTFTINGVVNGAGGNVATTGPGTVVLTAENTYTGTTAVNVGILQLGGGGASGSITNSSGITVAGGAKLAVNRSDTLTIPQVIQGAGSVRKLGSGIVVLNAANTYTGGTEIDEGIVRVGAVNSLPIAGVITLANVAGAALDLNGNNATIGALSGGGALGGNVTLGSATLTVGDATSTTYGGGISGAGGSIIKQGTGTLTLTNSSTYTGSTTINLGAIRSGTNDALPVTTALTLANAASVLLDLDGFIQTVGSLAGGGGAGGMVALGSGTLTVGDSTHTSFAGTISGTGGSIIKQGSGTLTLSGANTYSGTTTINAGTLSIADSTNLGDASPGNDVTLSGGTLEATGTFGLGSNRDIALVGGGGTINVAGSNIVIVSGLLSGMGSLAKTGSGTLILSGTNSSFNGILEINAGSIRASASENLGTGVLPNSLVFTGGTLEAIGSFSTGTRGMSFGSAGGTIDVTGSNAVTFTSYMTGVGGLTKTGPGRLTLAADNSLFYSGPIGVSDGTLSASASDRLGDGSVSNSLAFAGGTFEATGSFDLGASRTVAVGAGGGTFKVTSGNTLTVSGAISGSATLTKSDGGTLNLVADNSGFSGPLAITGGTVEAAASNRLGSGAPGNALTLAAGTLRATGSFDLGSGRALTLGLGGGTVDVNPGATLTASGSIAGSGSLTKTGAGTFVISGNANSYAGGTVIDAGTLQLANPGGSATGSGGITVNNGATLAGDGSVSGPVTVNGGGTISPGASIGTMELVALTFAAGAHLSIRIDSANLLSDLLSISNLIPADGDLTLSGPVTLDITDINFGALDLHDAIVFATYSGERLGGGFFRVPGFEFDLLDYTGDDMSASYFFLGSTPMAIDYNYNDTGTVAFVVVPEPTALAALIGGMGILLGTRRLRRRTA
ncbi:MAG: autotransporter-associated beta strand repeat-containing protein [Chthoniobacteraceae bacterium]